MDGTLPSLSHHFYHRTLISTSFFKDTIYFCLFLKSGGGGGLITVRNTDWRSLRDKWGQL